MKKTTVSIGIAAHNEEHNIAFVLKDILQQKQDMWELKEILIYCDGCTDATVENIIAVNNRLIRVIVGKKQQGKSHGLNQIFAKVKGEFLVLFDADIKLGNKSVITSLIKSLLSNTNIAVVGGNTRPILPKSFFERAVYSTFLVFDESRLFVNNGNNIFGCNGACIAMRTFFAKKLKLPSVVNDDDYIYFSCIKKGYTFIHNRSAIVYYKLPHTVKDYIRQIFRSNPEAVKINISSYFGKIVEEEYKRPMQLYLRAIIKSFLKFPLETISIITINLAAKPLYQVITTHYKLSWHSAASTKKHE